MKNILVNIFKIPLRPLYSLLLSISFLLLFTACGIELPWPSPIPTSTPQPPAALIEAQDEAVVEAVAEAPGPVPFAVLYAVLDIQRAIYEPSVGTYLGAWLWQGLTKPAFEEKTDQKHAVFAMEMQIGDEFPTTWILQALSAQVAPLIILHMPDDLDNDFPLAEIASFAYELGRYNLPAFIVFNPLAPGHEIYPEDYVLLFRYSRIIFRSHAPMAAFVWHGYNNTANAESPFYPGHDVVDWVSLALLAPQTAEGFEADILAQLKPFHQSFQQYKPIIALPLGIGHFSRRDYVYRIPQAAAEITRVFEAIRDSFPRVRMIVYANNGISTYKGDDFSLTRQADLMAAYASIVTDDHFITRLTAGGSTDNPQWMRATLHGYYYEGQVFIDQEIFEARQLRTLPTTTKEINDRTYISISAIDWMKIATDHTRRVIYMHFPG